MVIGFIFCQTLVKQYFSMSHIKFERSLQTGSKINIGTECGHMVSSNFFNLKESFCLVKTRVEIDGDQDCQIFTKYFNMLLNFGDFWNKY